MTKRERWEINHFKALCCAPQLRDETVLRCKICQKKTNLLGDKTQLCLLCLDKEYDRLKREYEWQEYPNKFIDSILKIVSK